MEEERRNCFVAITRTKKTLCLSYAAMYSGWPKSSVAVLERDGIAPIAQEQSPLPFHSYASSETANTLPAFREAMKLRRCLVGGVIS